MNRVGKNVPHVYITPSNDSIIVNDNEINHARHLPTSLTE